MTFTLVQILSSISIFLLIFLAGVLVTSRKSTTSSKILGIFLLLNAVHMLGGLIFLSDITMQRPVLAFWANAFPLTFGPLLWFYTKDLLYKDYSIRRRELWHFLPFLILTLLTIVFFHEQPRDRQIEIMELARESFFSLPILAITSILTFIHIFIYLILSILNVRHHQKRLKTLYSYYDTVDLRWLLLFLISYGIILLVSFINSFFDLLDQSTYHALSLLSLLLLILIFATTILHRVLTFPHFFRGHREHHEENKDYYLGENERKNILADLNKIIEQQHIFTRTFLNLEVLAATIETSTEDLSEVIEREKRLDFFDYINEQRINMAKEQLSDPDKNHKTILDIMYEVGFNSKSSFYDAFKKYAGCSPIQFRQKNNPSLLK